MDGIMAQIEAMVGAATSLEELREMLANGFPAVDVGDLVAILGLGLVAAHDGGRVAAIEDAE